MPNRATSNELLSSSSSSAPSPSPFRRVISLHLSLLLASYQLTLLLIDAHRIHRFSTIANLLNRFLVKTLVVSLPTAITSCSPKHLHFHHHTKLYLLLHTLLPSSARRVF